MFRGGLFGYVLNVVLALWPHVKCLIGLFMLFLPQYSLVNEPLIELTNPGASGSLFYLTSDDEFIIKTVQHKEAKFLQRLLPGYYMVRHLSSLHEISSSWGGGKTLLLSAERLSKTLWVLNLNRSPLRCLGGRNEKQWMCSLAPAVVHHQTKCLSWGDAKNILIHKNLLYLVQNQNYCLLYVT